MTRRILVGGTGRSGTTITARLIGSHPRLNLIPYELRFHASDGGLADVVEGRAGLDVFTLLMEGAFWRQEREARDPGGMHRLIDEAEYRAALERFPADFADDREEAGRALLRRLVDPLAGRKDGWVEHTPENAREAGTLLALLPDAVLVHVVRDGRDVAASLLQRSWGPQDPTEAVWWWARRMLQAAAATADHAERVIVIRHEGLLERDVRSVLLEGLGVGTHRAVERFARDQLEAASANIGRWTTSKHRTALDGAYAAARSALRADDAGAVLDRVLGPPDGEGDPVLIESLGRYLADQDSEDAARLQRFARVAARQSGRGDDRHP